MSTSQPSERELLQSVLQPLLVDFDYWFSSSKELLERGRIDFLSEAAQADLIARVSNAQHEVNVAKLLFQAVDGQAGIEASQMVSWHQIVTECWQVSVRLRQSEQSKMEE
jgi:hypothetical protein